MAKLTKHLLAPNDILKAGPYVIQLCGANSQYVKQDLDLMWNTLQGVIADAHYGAASPAYQAFFKDSIYDTFVDKMFTNITNGAPIQKLNANSPVAPAITCITGPNMVVENTGGGERDLWNVCAGNPNFAAFYRSGTNWIFLCPFFFKLVQKASIPQGQTSFCPAVSGNQFESQWGPLVQNQMYILMHESKLFFGVITSQFHPEPRIARHLFGGALTSSFLSRHVS